MRIIIRGRYAALRVDTDLGKVGVRLIGEVHERIREIQAAAAATAATAAAAAASFTTTNYFRYCYYHFCHAATVAASSAVAALPVQSTRPAGSFPLLSAAMFRVQDCAHCSWLLRQTGLQQVP